MISVDFNPDCLSNRMKTQVLWHLDFFHVVLPLPKIQLVWLNNKNTLQNY